MMIIPKAFVHTAGAIINVPSLDEINSRKASFNALWSETGKQ